MRCSLSATPLLPVPATVAVLESEAPGLGRLPGIADVIPASTYTWGYYNGNSWSLFSYHSPAKSETSAERRFIDDDQELSEMTEMNRAPVPTVCFFDPSECRSTSKDQPMGALPGGVEKVSTNDNIGQKAKGPRLVTFDRTSACDIIEKLRRDIARIDSSTECAFARDHTVNAFWTAWHIHQWMWDAISNKPDLKLAVLKYRGIERYTIEDHETFGAVLAGRFVPLKICRMIATASRYVQVSSTDVQATMSVDTLGANDNLVRSKPMVIVMGRPIAATRLLVEIDDYWVTMITDCGLE